MSESARSVCGTCLAPLGDGVQVCPRCGWRAAFDGQPESRGEQTDAAERSGSPDIDRGTRTTFGIGTLLLIITLVGVLLGIGVSAPGLGVLLALFAVPPVIRTTMVVQARKSAGRETGLGEKSGLFLMSAFVTWVIVSVLVSACCLTFCGVCAAGLVASGEKADPNLLVIFSGAAALVTAFLVIWAFGFWIRARWRRDVAHRKSGG